jgi:alkylated DNA repair dioxygenase AlkB
MTLFNNEVDIHKNVLPNGGIVNYYGSIFDSEMADHYFDLLMQTTDWKNDETKMFGKTIITKRKVAWYGDKDYDYSYSKTIKKALPWTPTLVELKSKAEAISGELYNSCLLNLYHNGSEGMSWHSDNEKELKPNGAICSLSFGAERKFSLKNRGSNETISLLLENGSMLVMKGETQKNWVHSLPVSKRIVDPRINLTFRTIIT